MKPAVAGLIASALSIACEPELLVGSLNCTPPDAIPREDKVIPSTWSTGFEMGFCEYIAAGGRCYASGEASYDIVETPVRSGRKAAAYSLVAGQNRQARCYLEGELPQTAVYGAWFHVPENATNRGNWNLFHFRDARPMLEERGLWDVSIQSKSDGSLALLLRDFVSDRTMATPADAPRIPIGSWFHVELLFQRAADATGAVTLYQDGEPLIEVTDVVTDDTDFAQWYVGNLATALTPASSTLYVDDVTISPP
jgi:hypothetical protein